MSSQQCIEADLTWLNGKFVRNVRIYIEDGRILFVDEESGGGGGGDATQLRARARVSSTH